MRSFTLLSLYFVAGSCFLSLFLLLAAAAPATEPNSVEGHWEGSIQLPGKPLDVRVDLLNTVGKWTGKIDIPQQNVSGLTLDPVEVKGTALKFTINGVPGEPTFDGKLDAGKITGTFMQGPLALPFTLGRDRIAVAAPKRPQEAITTASYKDQEIAYDSGPIHLAGTLSVPVGKPPFPAVLLITGSGPQNRDEELLGHKPFKVIADRLAQAGIAVLRVDDPGVGGSSGGPVDHSTTADFANDALAGVKFLRSRSEIDPHRIGLIGHSEGGMIAPMAAAQSTDVAFIIILAGPGVPGDQILIKQAQLIAIASGVDAATAKQQADELATVLKTVEANADPAVVAAKLRELAQHQNDALPLGKRRTTEQANAQADAESRSLTTPWFRFFLSYDPRTALRKVTVPTLALGGELDRQVSPEQNLPEIEKALREGGNQDVTVRRLPGLNHLFQTAHSGSPDEYGTIEETFSDAAIDVMRTWILRRFATPTSQPAKK